MNKRIFLVDDDADDRLLFSEAIEEISSGIKLDVAANGRIGLNLLRKNDIAIPDLIFLDINMPLVDGWNFITAIKQDVQFKDIPVIMYSTSSFQEDIEKAKTHGALCFFTKPCNFVELKKSLECVIAHLENGTLERLPEDSDKFATVSH